MRKIILILLSPLLVVGTLAALSACVREQTPAPPSVTGIEIYSLPNKTEYAVGEDIDPEGLTFYAHMSDGTKKYRYYADSGAAVYGFESAAAGLKKLVLFYEGHIAEFSVTVEKPPTFTIEIIGDGYVHDFTASRIYSGEGRHSAPEVVYRTGRECDFSASLSVEGWVFLGWKINGVTVSTHWFFTETAEGDKLLTAYYAKRTVNHVYIDTDGDPNVAGAGFYTPGDTVKLNVIDGTDFVAWTRYVYAEINHGGSATAGYSWRPVSYETEYEFTAETAETVYAVYTSSESTRTFTTTGGAIKINFADGTEYICRDTLDVKKLASIPWRAEAMNTETQFFTHWETRCVFDSHGFHSDNTYELKNRVIFDVVDFPCTAETYTAYFTSDTSRLRSVTIVAYLQIDEDTRSTDIDPALYAFTYDVTVVHGTKVDAAVTYDPSITVVEFGVYCGGNIVGFGSLDRRRDMVTGETYTFDTDLYDFGRADTFYIVFKAVS